MSLRVNTWDEETAGKEIHKRFQQASDSRKYFEFNWARTENTIFNVNPTASISGIDSSLTRLYPSGQSGPNSSNVDVNPAYSFKNFRFIHAQMSSNPPIVAMRPTSSDQDDHRKADAADRVVRWAIRHYNMQEKIDQLTLQTLLYGTGVLKTVWDSSLGDIIDFDKESGEIKMEGDIAVTVPFMWNIFVDPDAKSLDEVKWVIERIYMDFDEACARYPSKKEELEKARVTTGKTTESGANGVNTQLMDKHYNTVELLEYCETGLPSNGYLGRFCITTSSGDVIRPCGPNPHRFRGAGAVSRLEQADLPEEVIEAKIAALPEKAQLPYHFLTDIDVANSVYGKSFVEYVSGLQETITKVDAASVNNVQAHGAARAILPESAEVLEMTDDTWNVMRIAGNQPPYFMSPPQQMPEMVSLRTNLKQDINDVSGVNEAMFGQQSRETSGTSMQYATNQGNMIRRRLFNKYVLVVESIYKSILNLSRKHWTVSRIITVIGKEKALEAIDLKGADIDGGYDVVGEYGTTLSLDPISRQQQVLTMYPMFKEAGMSPRAALKLMKMSELEGMFDRLELAGSRQKEIFDLMIATGRYVAPKKFRDHQNMIAWALDYFMTSEFEQLPEEAQVLCEKHIEERAALAAQEAPAPAPAAAPTPAGPPSI